MSDGGISIDVLGFAPWSTGNCLQGLNEEQNHLILFTVAWPVAGGKTVLIPGHFAGHLESDPGSSPCSGSEW